MPFPTNDHPPPKWLSILWTITWIGMVALVSSIVIFTDAPFLTKIVLLGYATFSWYMVLIGIDYYRARSR